MIKQSNLSPVRNDMRDILEGKQRGDGGKASLACNLVPLLSTYIVHKWSDGSEEHTDDFTVADFILRKPRNDDGSVHRNLQGLRRNAILSNIFGYGPEAYENQDIKAALDKALPASIALRHYYANEHGALPFKLDYLPGDVEGRKRVFVGVPARDVFDLVMVDAEGNAQLTATGKHAMAKCVEPFMEQKHRMPRNDEETQAFMLARPVATSGTVHPVYGVKSPTAVQFLDRLVARAVADGILPEVTRNSNRKIGAVVSMAESVQFIAKQLDSLLSTDEMDDKVEPINTDTENLMDHVAEQWAAYRARFPRETLDV